MNGLLLSISFLCIIFSIIAGFVVKLYFDEKRIQAEGRPRPPGSSNSADTLGGSQAHQQDDDEASSDGSGNLEGNFFKREKKVGKKKLAKLQAKAESKAQREQEVIEREERKRIEEQRLKEDEQKKLLQIEEDRKLKEKRRLEKEKKEKHELEEYNKIKESFNVEEHGFEFDENLENEEEQNLKFLSYIKVSKVVHIDELASKFKLKSEDIIQRLKACIEHNEISGVFDDRGKFIHISEDELLSVSKFITQRGRVSLKNLAQYSNHLISLDSDSLKIDF